MLSHDSPRKPYKSIDYDQRCLRFSGCVLSKLKRPGGMQCVAPCETRGLCPNTYAAVKQLFESYCVLVESIVLMITDGARRLLCETILPWRCVRAE